MRKPLAWWAVANTGRYAWVPPVIATALIPAGLLALQSGAPPQVQLLYVDTCARQLAPALAVWWPAFVFKERIEVDGRELLYLLQPRGQSLVAVVLAAAYAVLLVPFMVTATRTDGVTVMLLAPMVARSALMAAFTFCAAFVLRSSAMALVGGLLFGAILLAPLEAVAGGFWISSIALCVALSVVLLVGGEAASRRFSG